MKTTRFDDIDKQALENALLRMHQCPRCRRDLLPVAFTDRVWGCKDCRETWFVEEAAS